MAKKNNKYIQYSLFDMEADNPGISSITREAGPIMPQDTHTIDVKSGDVADDKTQDARSYFTPREVVDLMVKLLDPKPEPEQETKIYDPCCGSGALLMATIQCLKEKENPAEAPVSPSLLYGQEPHPDLYTQAKAALSQQKGVALLAPTILEGDTRAEGPDSNWY